MEDGTDSGQFASAVIDGQPMPVGGTVVYADSNTLVGSEPLPKLAADAFFSGSVFGLFTGAWQVDWYVNIPLASFAGTNTIMRITGTGTVRTWEVRLDTGTMTVNGYNSSGGLVTSTSSTPFDFFDRWVHMRLEARQSGTSVRGGYIGRKSNIRPLLVSLVPLASRVR